MILTAEALRQHALACFRNGAFQPALAAVIRALAQTPDDGRLWELRGLIHRSRNEPQQSLYALETASVYVPLRLSARCALAECYAHFGKRDLARQLYGSLLNDSALPEDLLLLIAAGCDRIGDSGLALKACREALRRDPESAQACYDMGYYLGRCGHPRHLIEAMARKAVSLAPECVQFRVGLASFLVQAERGDEAYDVVARLTAAEIAGVTCRCCLVRLADLYDSEGDEPRAGWCREQASRLASESDAASSLEDSY